VGYIDGLAVDGDGECCGLHLRRDGRGLDAGCGVGGEGKREKDDEERAKTRQEMRLRLRSEDATTLAPGVGRGIPQAVRAMISRSSDHAEIGEISW
jgi:hypothetical protein